jgi:hypothetical protein
LVRIEGDAFRVFQGNYLMLSTIFLKLQ